MCRGHCFVQMTSEGQACSVDKDQATYNSSFVMRTEFGKRAVAKELLQNGGFVCHAEKFFASPPSRVLRESLTSIVQTCPPLVSIRETSGCLVPFALHAADACLLLRLQLLVAARYFSFARQMGERRLRLTLKEQYSVRNL